MEKQRLTYLIDSYSKGIADPRDQKEFFDYLESGENKDLFVEVLTELENQYADDSVDVTPFRELALQAAAIDKHVFDRTTPRIYFLRKWGWAAAVLFIIIGSAVYLNYKKADEPIVKLKPVPAENDIPPGSNKAVLRLADGSEIILDNASRGKLAEQSGASIEKSGGGQIIYSQNKNIPAHTVVYNTMTTPRGGQYQLSLPDGSKLWLNAESSITFPTAFVENTREVKITGEVYFEIKANKQKPFIVKAGEEKIEVLGTGFNVNNYPDEQFKTSLVEGAISINKIILKPGQAYADGKIVSTNIRQDVAWKNGYFSLENLSLEQAMRQFARWYDLEIEYVNGIPGGRFAGEMDRTLPLSDVLEFLKGSGINFKINGRKLTIINKEK